MSTESNRPDDAELDRLRRELARARRDAAQWRRTLQASESMSEQSRHALMRVQGELQHTIADLGEARDRAESANAAKDRFIAVTSHELRTPLHGVIGTLDLLSRTALAPDQQQLLRIARQSAGAMLAIIDDLLDVAKADAGALQLESIEFDVRGLVDDVLDAMRSTAALKGLAMLGHVDAAVPVRVVGDPTRLRQVLLNLIGNAVKFTPDGEVRVHVAYADGASRLQLRVEDTGVGIPEAALPHVFVAFRQAAASTAREFGGTGLGLAICKRLVELMGGQIRVHSAAGVGTCFEFEVQVEPASTTAISPESAVTPQAPTQPTPGARPLALVVDDHQLNRLIVSRMLGELGFDSVSASDGHEAVRLATSRSFDVVLMDCSMPGLDGPDATRAIRAAGFGSERLPIVALTASVTAEDRQRCADAGMDAHLAKPMRLVELRQVLRRVVTGD